MPEPHPRGTCRGVRLVVIASLTFALWGCAAAAQDQPLRVMTYNIAAGHGDLTAVAASIRAADADIVALQEVDVRWSDRSAFADQAAALAEALGMAVRFGRIYRLEPARPGLPPREFGVAVLSRHPIDTAHNHSITRLSTQTRDPVPEPLPGFLEVNIRIRNIAVRVFSTHLDYRADPRVRAAQVADMLRVLAGPAQPIVLLGDLNAPPHAPELQPLLRILRDAWQASPDPPTDPGYTYPADAPDRRIDYVLISEHFRVRAVRVPDTRASDHRPVVAELELTSKR